MKIRLVKVIELSEDGNKTHFSVQYKKNIFDFWHHSKSFWKELSLAVSSGEEKDTSLERANKYFDALVETEGQDRFETILKETEL